MNPRDTTGTRARAGWIVGGVSVLAVFVFYLVGMTSAGVPEGEMPFVVVASAVASFLFGYIVWASYWGVPAAWVWWRRVTKAPLDVLASRFRLSGCVLLVLLLFLPATLTLVALYFWIPFLVGIVYGTFGGGVSAYRRDRRSLRLQRAAALFLGVLVHLGCSPDRATERVLYENALDSIDDVLTRTGTTVDAPTSSDGHGSIRIEASAAR